MCLLGETVIATKLEHSESFREISVSQITPSQEPLSITHQPSSDWSIVQHLSFGKILIFRAKLRYSKEQRRLRTESEYKKIRKTKP